MLKSRSLVRAGEERARKKSQTEAVRRRIKALKGAVASLRAAERKARATETAACRAGAKRQREEQRRKIKNSIARTAKLREKAKRARARYRDGCRAKKEARREGAARELADLNQKLEAERRALVQLRSRSTAQRRWSSAESDDYVRAATPAPWKRTWDRVRKRFKGSPQERLEQWEEYRALPEAEDERLAVEERYAAKALREAVASEASAFEQARRRDSRRADKLERLAKTRGPSVEVLRRIENAAAVVCARDTEQPACKRLQRLARRYVPF